MLGRGRVLYVTKKEVMTFGFQFEPPEEWVRHMQEHQHRHEMQADDYRHSVQRMLDELNEDQLIALRWMMRNIAMGGSQLAQYYEGQLSQLLYLKFNICPGCMVNHEKELAEHAEPKTPADAVLDEVAKSTTQLDPKAGPKYHTDEQKLQMAEYNLDDAYEDETRRFLGYICKGCGMMYPSIEDRMLRPADECSGCIQKAKWG